MQRTHQLDQLCDQTQPLSRNDVRTCRRRPLRRHITSGPRRRRSRTVILPPLELRKPRITPSFALSEFGGQRRGCVGLTRITSATKLRPYLRHQRIPLLLRHIRPTHAFLASPELRKPLPTPRQALSEFRRQCRTRVGLTVVTSPTQLCPRRLPGLCLVRRGHPPTRPPLRLNVRRGILHAGRELWPCSSANGQPSSLRTERGRQLTG